MSMGIEPRSACRNEIVTWFVADWSPPEISRRAESVLPTDDRGLYIASERHVTAKGLPTHHAESTLDELKPPCFPSVKPGCHRS